MQTAIAVIISDIHYSLPTLELADASMRQAIDKANALNIPLIVSGDLHDTKANLRAECANAMIETFKYLEQTGYIIVGNHDKINEKSVDNALLFLVSLDVAWLINSPCYITEISMYMIPYQHDIAEFKTYLDTVPKGSTVIMHQGIQSSLSGDYVIDKSAIPREWLADYRVISGHYHTRQDIKCGRPRAGSIGLASYIGNPYSLSFGEAKDPEKGYQVLYDNGTLEFVPTNLRKHVIIEIELWDSYSKVTSTDLAVEGDLVWVKVKGTKELLATHTKSTIRSLVDLPLPENFKLDLIPLESEADTTQAKYKELSQPDTLIAIVDSLTNVSDDQKSRLKKLLKESM